MDFNVDEWCAEFLRKLEDAFGGGLVFVGLQGSRGRGEASEESDVDLVVVLKELAPRELGLYADAVASMPFAEKACGFICGEEVLRAHHFTVSITEVLCVRVDDVPGGLNAVVQLLQKEGISLEYLYAYISKSVDASVIFYVKDCARAEEVLRKNGIRLLSEAY